MKNSEKYFNISKIKLINIYPLNDDEIRVLLLKKY